MGGGRGEVGTESTVVEEEGKEKEGGGERTEEHGEEIRSGRR